MPSSAPPTSAKPACRCREARARVNVTHPRAPGVLWPCAASSQKEGSLQATSLPLLQLLLQPVTQDEEKQSIMNSLPLGNSQVRGIVKILFILSLHETGCRNRKSSQLKVWNKYFKY